MIVLDHEQGSPEWIAARLGIPTSSCFARIITPKTLKLSSSADGYMCELLAEWMLGASLDPYVSEWMERGKELEEQAFAYYAFARDAEPSKVGVILSDDAWVGCSPDALVGEDGGLEIKCPAPAKHVANMLDMTTHYMTQVQGGMWLTGRKWWDMMSYHPELPTAIVRIERDEEYIGALASAVGSFLTRLHDAQCALIEAGHVDDGKRRLLPGLVE